MAITDGGLPSAKQKDFLDWARLRERELLDAWSRAERHLPIGKIARP